MKNLTAIISLFAITSLALLAVAAFLGVSCPYWSVAWRVAGFAWAAGVLGLFLTDYAPHHPYTVGAAVRVTEPQRESVPAVRAIARHRRRVPATAQPFDDTGIEGAMATVGFCNDPATVSMS
jgi:hypothetical protein